jgi:mono/diheme cytochrome c family protein
MPSVKRFPVLYILFLPLAGIAATPTENWETLCAKCHGANGDGKTNQGLKLKSKDYTDPKVQAEFADVALLKNALLGVEDADGVSRMPAFKDKLTVPEAKELIILIRSFKK